MNNKLTNLTDKLNSVLLKYQTSFTDKIYGDENEDYDILMDVFALTPYLKRENRQYWGRELGMCWQLLVVEICQNQRSDSRSALRFGSDEPCDIVVGNYAIDTKYRVGSGDSGTLKKFKAYGPLLRENGYEPIMLILREDNLPAAIKACEKGGWDIYIGAKTFKFIEKLTEFDFRSYLSQKAGDYTVHRD